MSQLPECARMGRSGTGTHGVREGGSGGTPRCADVGKCPLISVEDGPSDRNDRRMTLDHAGAHEATYRRLMAALTAGRDEEADELLAAEFVDHNPMPGQSPGPAGFKEWMGAARAAFPDLAATVEDVVAGDDRLAARVRYRGTHGG